MRILILPLEVLPGADAGDQLHQGQEDVHLDDPSARPEWEVPVGGSVRFQ